MYTGPAGPPSDLDLSSGGLLGRVQGLLGGAAAFFIAVTGFLKMVNGLRRTSGTVKDIDPEQEEFDTLVAKRDALKLTRPPNPRSKRRT